MTVFPGYDFKKLREHGDQIRTVAVHIWTWKTYLSVHTIDIEAHGARLDD